MSNRKRAAAMANEQQQPMSDARLQEIWTLFELLTRTIRQGAERATFTRDFHDIKAEVERLRARENESQPSPWPLGVSTEEFVAGLKSRIRELTDENERLRAREAAAMEVVRAVAGGTWAAAVGQGHTPYWTALIHHETNIVEQARALLASDSQS